jgi:AcrR family transcriptional regulator
MELKTRILENASELFSKKGIKSMTMSDIANESGISKRTLYEVFHDKEELLEECVNIHINKADKEIKILTDNSENVVDSLMRIYAKHLKEAKSINKSVIHDLKKYHPQIYERVESRQQSGIDKFIPLLHRGVEQGLLRNDVNFEVVLWLLKCQFKTVMEDDYMPTDKYSTEEFIRVIILNFIRGIATPLGSEKIDSVIEKIKNKSKETVAG